MNRAYHFCNYYLSSIQQGIQAAHAQTEMACKYKQATPIKRQLNPGDLTTKAVDMFWEWAKQPTMICLNGGNHDDLQSIKRRLDNIDDLKGVSAYPWSYFHEDSESLCGMLTNVCIILPQKIWSAHSELVAGKKYTERTPRGKCSKTFSSFIKFYDYATENDGEAHSALRLFERLHGSIDDADADMIDMIRGYRLAA